MAVMQKALQMARVTGYAPHILATRGAGLNNARSYIPVAGALLSAVIVFIIFITAGNNQFVALDDYGYIVDNRNIATLSWATVTWSFTSFCEANWHPLTMLSLALDRALWGVKPFGYHVENVVIHACSVFTAYFLFSSIFKIIFSNTVTVDSGAPSLDNGESSKAVPNPQALAFGSLAAALFWGLHPLRVESVVWASERKDVLCLLFITVSLLMYVRYAAAIPPFSARNCWRSGKYGAAFVFAALALMSKPTAVTLPLIMSIIDYYPLKRITNIHSMRRSLLEKTPLYLLATGCVVLTIIAQQGAMKSAPPAGLLSRLLIACKALLFYLYATVIPAGLTAFYMHPGEIVNSALPEYALYALLILGITIFTVSARRRFPALPAFWLFYLVTLAPTLGIIQVGGQWAADRYSYLPSLGIALAWGAVLTLQAERIQRNNRSGQAWPTILLAAILLTLYTALTLRQIRYWRTTETLTSRIIDRAPNRSSAPYLARAIYRNRAGRYREALEDTHTAMKIALRSESVKAQSEIAFEQAVILKDLGQYGEALTIMDWGLAISPKPPADALELRNELSRLPANKAAAR